MELSRYHELFFSEAATYLQQLNRHLLGLEGEAPEALEGAFRAAHTLKGMAATVGFSKVASRAHALEDQLARLRGGKGVSADTVDALLDGVDGLERAVAAAQDSGVSVPEPSAADEAAVPGMADVPGEATTWTAPDGTKAVVHVEFRSDAPLRGVRAAMVLRNLRGLADVLGHAPADLGDDLSGDLVLFLKTKPDGAALEAAIRAAGEVETVVVEQAEDGTDASEAPSARTLPSQRFVRVERRHVTALADAVGELTALHGELERAFAAGLGAGDALDRMRRLLAELRTTAMAVRLVPVAEVFDRFPRLVRDAARKAGKTVDLGVEGREIELDRTILEGLSEPLVHLLRNAVDHGLESPEQRKAAGKPTRGRVWLRARRDRGGVLITVADDGRGVDVAAVRRQAVKRRLATKDEAEGWTAAELLTVLSRPGFSAAAKVSELSGRGVGLDVVASRVRSVGGALEMHTDAGRGTTFEMRLPVTLALADAVWVAVGGERFAIPLTHVTEVRELDKRRRRIRFRGETYPVVDLGDLLGMPSDGVAGAAVLVDVAGRRSALLVDALLGHERIVVKDFDVPREAHPLVSAATLRADGRPALVLDPAAA